MRKLELGAAALLAIMAAACGDDSAAVGGSGGDGGFSVGGENAGGGGGGELSCDGTESDDPQFSQALDVLRATLAVNSIPGGAIAVVKDGQLVDLGVIGTKRAGLCDPVTPDTLFVLPYAPVILTSIAALDAVEEGKLSLTEPITDTVDLSVETGAGFVDDITLHHLLTSSSMLSSIADIQPQQSTCTGLADSVENMVDSIIEAAPGSMMDWDDRHNVELAALMLQTVDKQPFREVIAARVLEPLGMGGTFDLATAQAADHSFGSQGNGVDGALYDCPNHDASYGYWGSIRDYAKLGEYLTGDGAAVLSPTMFEAFGSKQGPSIWSNDYVTYWGGGWAVPTNGEVVLFRGGGSTAGFNQMLLVFPDRRLAIMVMINRDAFVSERAALEIAEIYGAPGIDTWPQAEYDQDPETLQTLAGTYFDAIGFLGSGPRTLEVSWDPDEPGIIEGALTSGGNAPQALSFDGQYYPDNFIVSSGPLGRFWRDELGVPLAASVGGYNGPPFFRVSK